jgi:integrase
MDMGRTRTNSRLPPRMHLKAGRYYHVTYVGGKRVWTKLGADYGAALGLWANREKESLTKGETFDDLAREFTARAMPKFRKNTQESFTIWLGHLMRTFAGVKLAEIKPAHVYAHIEKREKEGAKVSGKREKTLLSIMFSRAVEWDWVTANPVKQVRVAREKPRTRYVTDAEFAAVYGASRPIIQLIMEVGYITGLRIGDILALKLSNLSDDGIRLYQEKNEVKAHYKMTPALRSVIDRAKAIRRRRGTFYLFPNREGHAYTYSGFRAVFRRTVIESGVADFHFHDIRAKATTDAHNLGRDAQSFSLHKTREQAEAYVKARNFQSVEPLEFLSTMARK